MIQIHIKIYGLITFIGVMIVIGSLGDSDLEKINFMTLVIRSIIGLIFAGVGFIGLKKGGCFNEYV